MAVRNHMNASTWATPAMAPETPPPSARCPAVTSIAFAAGETVLNDLRSNAATSKRQAAKATGR
eukprot:scaffold7704_cov112-Isochrysis_galbana.AAC.14